MVTEEEVKSILKSLTLSSPNGIVVSNLCRDYQEMIGYSIPYKQLGYSDLMGFLNNIPDTLVLSGFGMTALVIPVTDEKTAHLEEMIQNQKKPSKSKSKKTRGRHYSHRVIQRPRAIKVETKKESCSEAYTAGQTSFSKPNILPTEKIEEKYHNYNDISSDESQSNHMMSKMNFHSTLKDEIHSTPTYHNETKLRVRSTNNSYNDYASSSISRKFTDPFKNKLRELISKYPDGIWCSELPKYYKNHFNENLNVSDKGYCSVIHFCTTHSDIFHCVKPNKCDWKIYDAQKPIPTFNNEVSLNNYFSDEESSMARKKDKALPELDMTDVLHFTNEKMEVMPNEILQFGEKIPRQWLQIPDDCYITIRVTEVYDPSKFWIQLYSEDCSVALDNLMNEMQDFYVLNEAYNIPVSNVQVGLYCVASIYNEWHRGIVVKIEDTYVKIFYFDYGSIGKSYIYSLKYLHKKFTILPRQAIRARLANIRPRYPAMMWSSKATELLLNMVNNRVLVAEVLNAMEIQEHTIHIILTDTSDPNEDVHINDELKKQGLAELEADFCKINTYKKNSPILKTHYFLYPNHQDIENGIVPNIDEVTIMRANGISIDMIFKPYISSIESDQVYSYNLNDVPHTNKSCQIDFYVSTNNNENEEEDTCREVDEILPETEYDSDERSSLLTDHTLQEEEFEEIDNPQTKYVHSPMSSIIKEEPSNTEELTLPELNNEKVEEVVNTASIPEESLNMETNFEPVGSAINVTISPPPGFHLQKPIISQLIDPYAIQNLYYNPYSSFPVPLPAYPAHIMQSMMYYGAAAAAAQTYLSSQTQFYHNAYSSLCNVPLASNTPEEIPELINIPISQPNVNNIVTKNQPFNNVSNSTLSSNLVDAITKQTDHLSLQNNDKLSIQMIVNDLKNDLKSLQQVQENYNREEICLLETQLIEIIRSITTENVVTSLAESLIKIIKSQISQVLLKEKQIKYKSGNQQNQEQSIDAPVNIIKNTEVNNRTQETNLVKQNNQSSIEIREKHTDASIQVDINYEKNILNNDTFETLLLTKNNCDVEKNKNIEYNKVVNLEKISNYSMTDNKKVSDECNSDSIDLPNNIDAGAVCTEREKTCEKLIEQLNISKDKSISIDNLCNKPVSKSAVELREFAQKSIHVIRINGECYFSTLEFLLTYTKFPSVDRVKSLFSSFNIDFPSIEFNLEQHSKHSYKKLLKKNVPGCFPKNPFIHLIKFKDVPIMLEKLFATNPALVKDLQNYTNEFLCK